MVTSQCLLVYFSIKPYVLFFSATASKSRRASDIISMLVNIYGSKELFVNEYRTLLADRILTNFNYEIGKEIRYLELLKVFTTGWCLENFLSLRQRLFVAPFGIVWERNLMR